MDNEIIEIMKKKLTLTLVVPMYNEEKRIRHCLRALRSFKTPKGIRVDRVIFVNDGSTDRTLPILFKSRLKFPISILSYEKNQGRGAAVRAGMQSATGDYAMFFDIDISTPLSEIVKFAPLMKKGVPVMTGTRKVKEAIILKPQPWYRTFLGKGFSMLSRMVLGVPVSDFTCGFKAYSRKAYTTIFALSRLSGWGTDSESLFIAHELGMKIVEVPVIWLNNPLTKVRIVRDIIKGFQDLFDIRLNEFSGFYKKSFVKKADNIVAHEVLI